MVSHLRRLTFVILLTIFVAAVSFGQAPSGYYDSANGLTGDALKSALNDIIDGHVVFSYEEVKDALRETDEDPLNSDNVICLYSGWSYGKYDFGNGSEDWNREHVWSKSHGDFENVLPAFTDLHHLRPADASVNSSKNNRDFYIGTEQVIDGSGPTDCYKSLNVWEPRDEVKGDVARMIFYMATRYEGENGEVDLEIVNYVNTAPNNEPLYGKKNILLQWNEDDPVDDWEINRNNIIYNNYQGNRNPYIDHPEYVDQIWGLILPEPSNQVLNLSVDDSTHSSLTLTWNDNDGTNPAEGFLLMCNTNSSFVIPIDGVEQNDDLDFSDGSGHVNVSSGTEEYVFTNLELNTTYYFSIYPYSNFGTNIDYKTDGIIAQTDGATSVSVTLFISEIADPSDVANAKYVELYNAGNSDIDFDNKIYYLSRQANGSGWADIQLTGVILANSTYIISYRVTEFFNSYNFNADINSGNASGNGDDGYFLFSDGGHETGTLIDAYGVIDVDGTGENWEYEDSKAVRKYSDTIASSVWNPQQWIISSSADHSDMTPGKHHVILTWHGNQSSEWQNNLNWNEGDISATFMPDAGSRVVISDGINSPVITVESTCDEINLSENATLTITTGTLKVGH